MNSGTSFQSLKIHFLNKQIFSPFFPTSVPKTSVLVFLFIKYGTGNCLGKMMQTQFFVKLVAAPLL